MYYYYYYAQYPSYYYSPPNPTRRAADAQHMTPSTDDAVMALPSTLVRVSLVFVCAVGHRRHCRRRLLI